MNNAGSGLKARQVIAQAEASPTSGGLGKRDHYIYVKA
jgi:hypothetical protein